MPLLFDTHAHIDQPEFAADLPQVIERAESTGLVGIVAVGTTADASRNCVAIAQQFPQIVSAAVGIQPNYVHEAKPGDWEEVLQLVTEPGVVAIGETGLDRYWDRAPFDLQQDYFDRHLKLAREHDLPFIVHMRECDEDILEMLRADFNNGPLRGIMHSFTGPIPMAQECLAMGMHISFAGMVTYKNAQDLRDVAKTIPSDRLLVETDSPYLSPQKVRKIRRNEPSHVIHTASLLADVRGVTLDQLASETTDNARRLFRKA